MRAKDQSHETHFLKLLKSREHVLRKSLHSLIHGIELVETVSTHDVHDFKDLAGAIHQDNINHFSITRMEDELLQIDEAQKRIESHLYGNCLDCGEQIDLKRLESMPATSFCVNCQTSFELAKKTVLV
jgi:DnaK suppressor protein